jgi:hypothetical protein
VIVIVRDRRDSYLDELDRAKTREQDADVVIALLLEDDVEAAIAAEAS